MKKILITMLLLSVVVVVSCGGSDTGDTGNTGDCSGNFPNYHKGLCWSDKAADAMNWDDAITYCTGLGGRLPNIQELRSLIHNCPKTEYPKPDGQDPWCEKEYPDNLGGSNCDGCPKDSSNPGKYSVFGENVWFWSSSSHVDYTVSAWSVSFTDGIVYYYGKIYNLDARCVR